MSNDRRRSGVPLSALADHIDHICHVTGGIGHVGIGSDLDGGFGTEQTPAEIDTIAFCLLRQEYPDKAFVTRAVNIEFERPATIGDVITFQARIARVGTTSVRVEVTGSVGDTPISTAALVYVNIGPDGKKAAISVGK